MLQKTSSVTLTATDTSRLSSTVYNSFTILIWRRVQIFDPFLSDAPWPEARISEKLCETIG